VAAHHESREPVRNHDSVEAGEPAALCHRLAGVTTAVTSSREVEYATMTDRHRPMTTGRPSLDPPLRLVVRAVM
jgi:hypothetical protein